jgi:hypothetical protein
VLTEGGTALVYVMLVECPDTREAAGNIFKELYRV